MQLRGLLYLGLALGAEGSKVVRFHAARNDNAAHLDRRATESGSSGSGNTAVSTAVQIVTATSTVADTSNTAGSGGTTTQGSGSGSTSSANGGSATGSSGSGDTTITRTVTVTDASADTVTVTSTIMKTVTSTIMVTNTDFKTETVTSSGATATSTVYETSTQWANEKRAINLAPRTVDNGIVIVEAQATSVPDISEDLEELELLRPRDLQKRATVTSTVTVTVGATDGKTVTNSATRTVISTVSSATKVTKTVTETSQAGASTTVTVTSTLIITSTRVTTGVVQTATVAPSGSYGTATADSSNSDSSSSSSGSSSGLSTGAKAGIGAGAGVAALVVLGILLWCCLKRRNKPSKSELDDMFGSSEVPVGGPGPMRDSSAHLSNTRMSQISPTIPNVAPVKSAAPEGYRGTALSDGRAGFAKPKPYGAAYAPAPAVSPETAYSRTATTSPTVADSMEVPLNAAELGNDGNAARWHQANAAEIDGNQVSSARGSSPPEHVYEMPAQQFK